MSSRRRRVCAAGLACWALAACGGDEDAPPPPPAEQVSAESRPPAASVAWEEARTSPVISLSANDATDLELHRGWPLILRAVVLPPGAFDAPGAAAAPFALRGAALRVRVTDAAGGEQAWALHAATVLPADVELAPDAAADAAWWLAGDETAALPEGRYTLVAELDTTSAASGWKGRAKSAPVVLTLSAEPSPLAPERARAKRHLALALLMLRGEREAAAAEVEALLRDSPDDLRALELHGDLLADGGREAEALAAFDRALAVFFERFPDAPEPPVTLLSKRHALLTQQLEPQ